MEIHTFLLQLVVILISARLFGEFAAKFKIPSVIGELFAGIVFGPSLFNLIEPTAIIQLLAEIGIILLLFEVGIETDFGRLTKTGSKPFLVAIAGVLAPFSLGFFGSYYLFHLSLLISLFIGSLLTATSIGITMRVLTELKKQGNDETQIVLGAAVIDDIIGIIMLSVLYEFSQGGGVSIFNTGKILGFICLFLILAPVAAKFISAIIKNYSKKSEIPGLIPSTTVAVILFFAWLAHVVGAPVLLGGFAAGLALSRQFNLPLGSFFYIGEEFSHKVEHEMKPIIHLFAPIFFFTIGLSLNFREIDWGSTFIWTLTAYTLVAAIFGKVISGFMLIKEKRWVKWAVGIAMVPRGEVGLIFAEMGKKADVFDKDLYASMILVIAITTIFTPFVIRALYSNQDQLQMKK